MKFYFGLYDSGYYWATGDMSHEIEDNRFVIDEVWKNYGEKYKSFGDGISVARSVAPPKGRLALSGQWGNSAKMYRADCPPSSPLGSTGKRRWQRPALLSRKEEAVSVQQHEKEWDEIFAGIHDVVDAVAFQDGHIDYDELDAFSP